MLKHIVDSWTPILYIVEGKDLLAMDIQGTSDPYCKFRSVIIHILLQL